MGCCSQTVCPLIIYLTVAVSPSHLEGLAATVGHSFLSLTTSSHQGLYGPAAAATKLRIVSPSLLQLLNLLVVSPVLSMHALQYLEMRCLVFYGDLTHLWPQPLQAPTTALSNPNRTKQLWWADSTGQFEETEDHVGVCV